MIDDKGDVAATNDIVGLDGVFARAEARAVDEGSVGAAEVFDAPTGRGGADFGMATAHGAIVQNDLESREPARPDQRLVLPDLPIDVTVDAAEAYAPLGHGFSPSLDVQTTLFVRDCRYYDTFAAHAPSSGATQC